MDIKHTSDILSTLFSMVFFNEKPTSIDKLPGSGSDRVYYRLKNENWSAIGAFNENVKENEAFFSFTNTFLEIRIPVPTLYAIAPDRQHYLISDLGNETFYDLIASKRKSGNCGDAICVMKEVLAGLIMIQLDGGDTIDFSKCYPSEAFDRRAIMWDLNYFKYQFLKISTVPFDEQCLEDDFEQLADYLLQAPSHFFMYRDFQSRNIMMVGNKPFFIDYQGGRRGPLQYDLASLLFSPKTGLNPVQREVMLEYYIKVLESYFTFDRKEFINFYYAFALARIMQAIGAYGFRGIYEHKANFRSSIPLAIENLKWIKDNNHITIELPEIYRIIDSLAQSEWAQKFDLPANKLTVRVTSFSYKKGIPADPSENGGGFVFDCRGLPNPGRFPEYKNQTGLYEPVIQYLEQFDEVNRFQQNVRDLVKISLDEYLSRGFNHLMVSFGCTGGQHRSVYNAESFARWLENNFAVNVVLFHNEMKTIKANG